MKKLFVCFSVLLSALLPASSAITIEIGNEIRFSTMEGTNLLVFVCPITDPQNPSSIELYDSNELIEVVRPPNTRGDGWVSRTPVARWTNFLTEWQRRVATNVVVAEVKSSATKTGSLKKYTYEGETRPNGVVSHVIKPVGGGDIRIIPAGLWKYPPIGCREFYLYQEQGQYVPVIELEEKGKSPHTHLCIPIGTEEKRK